MAISKIDVATTATVVSAAKPNRHWFVLQNQSDADIYVSFDGTTPTLNSGASPGLKIAAGETFGFGGELPSPRPPVTAAITAITETGTKTLVIHEA